MWILLLLILGAAIVPAQMMLPRLSKSPAIDGNLAEWRDAAFTDGLWDIHRLRQSAWYEPARNRLTDHGSEPAPAEDLAARYYMAWDDTYLYLGAEVKDNVNDVSDPAHEPKRWYYKDSICWFIEAPRQAKGQNFGERDNAFCFVIDEKKPPYAAWWRHGAPGKTYIEEPLPADAVQWALKKKPGSGDFVLEARVAMKPTLGASSPRWSAPKLGDRYGIEIVHCDPDGGDYGGHFLIYGKGDDDSTWAEFELGGPLSPVERKAK